MKNFGRTISLYAIVLLSLLILAACGGSSSSPGGGQLTVTVSPTSASIPISTTEQFTATVTGSSNTAVSWFVNGTQNGNGTVGTITDKGLYTAPKTLPSPATVTVAAGSQAAPGQTASAKVTITTATVTITVSPASANVSEKSTQQFTATVNGTSNTAVTWEVNNIASGNATVGTINSSGLYTAPAALPSPATVTVTAVSQANATKTASAQATVINGIILTPTSLAMGLGANLQFTATGSSSGINWQVNQIAGGNSTVGTVDGTGLYIAPDATPATGSAITVTAISQADSTQFANAILTLTPTDPLGSVSNVQTITCPSDASIAGGTCYSLDVSCPEVADFTTYLKVNTPAATSVGTVLFGTNAGGATLYDEAWGTTGATTVKNVLAANFTTVQVSFGAPFTSAFPNGWLTGPGGVRRLACRYAAVVEWVYNNIHKASTTLPLCATGNSGGADAVAHSVAHYGLSSIFSMIEPTSGPPMSRLDYGCICTGRVSIGDANLPKTPPCGGQSIPSFCYEAKAAALIDPAYSTPICTNANGSGSLANQAQFISDSINNNSANNSYPKTAVSFVFGGQDTTSAVSQGMNWFNSVINPGPITPACVADAPDDIPSVADGAPEISNNIINQCHPQ